VRNIELKARYADLAQGRRLAGALGAEDRGPEHQVDTYFPCPGARLKLRQSSRTGAELIWYQRPDAHHARASDYLLLAIPDGKAGVHLLKCAFGVDLVVDKQRHLFLYDHVRIHLDEVVGLGTFIEFEAVLADGRDDAWGGARVAELTRHFRIAPADVLSVSYADLVRACGGAGATEA